MDKSIKLFVPGNSLEVKDNTFPGATIEQKLQQAIRRYLSSNSFVSGEIKERTPRLFIDKYSFDPSQIGYNVIARLI